MTRFSVPNGWGASGFVTVIPARDEEQRLPQALDALARDGRVTDVLVVANGCSDATADVAWTGKASLRVALLETVALPGGVGEARRMGMEAALDAAPHTGILATTDADSRVGPNWGALTLAALSRADVACGRIVPDPLEFARLPALVRRHGRLEDRVNALRAELDGARTPRQHDPLPRHNQSPGASLALRAECYCRAGGFDPIPCHEDRRLVERLEASGARVARPWGLTVIASCRLTGRARGGMADTIAARAADRTFLRRDIRRLHAEAAQLELEFLALYRDCATMAAVAA